MRASASGTHTRTTADTCALISPVDTGTARRTKGELRGRPTFYFNIQHTHSSIVLKLNKAHVEKKTLSDCAPSVLAELCLTCLSVAIPTYSVRFGSADGIVGALEASSGGIQLPPLRCLSPRYTWESVGVVSRLAKGSTGSGLFAQMVSMILMCQKPNMRTGTIMCITV